MTARRFCRRPGEVAITRGNRKPGNQAGARRGSTRRPPKPRPAGEFVDFVADQLEGLGDIEIRAMFGGHGIYLGGTFFGIVHRSRLYFRIAPKTLGEYEARGMKPFNPYGKPLTTYYEVPPEVQEDGAEVRRWARASARSAAGRGSGRRRRRDVR